jgi:hypothetical protein
MEGTMLIRVFYQISIEYNWRISSTGSNGNS